MRRGACAVDVADIYPGAEQLVKVAGARIVHTKYVPDASKLAELDEAAVKAAVLRSLARIGRAPQAIQLHWWGESTDPQLGRVAAALEEQRLKHKYFRCLGVTNMSVDHLRAVCASATVGVAQVALSLLDRRALVSLVPFIHSAANGILRAIRQYCTTTLPVYD
jgi:aryl-alcohol dehydrogenase-like predicted oxidoreductase